MTDQTGAPNEILSMGPRVWRDATAGIPLRWGGSISLGESQSRIYPNMCARFGCGPTVVSKTGGYRQTNRQTDKGTLQLYIVDTSSCKVRDASLDQLVPLSRVHTANARTVRERYASSCPCSHCVGCVPYTQTTSGGVRSGRKRYASAWYCSVH